MKPSTTDIPISNPLLDIKVIRRSVGLPSDNLQVTGEARATCVMDLIIGMLEFEHCLCLEVDRFVSFELEDKI